MKFKRFLEVGEGLLFGSALAGDIDLETLRYVLTSRSRMVRSSRLLANPTLKRLGADRRVPDNFCRFIHRYVLPDRREICWTTKSFLL